MPVESPKIHEIPSISSEPQGTRPVPAAGFLKSTYLRYFAKPVHDRRLFSLIHRHQIDSIVELGVGTGVRAVRMIELAQRHAAEVRYAGIDLFEARPDAEQGMSLKQAYKTLRATGAKVQLVPGDPFSSLARAANSLMGTQLLLISADQDEQSLERAWFYIPRILAPQPLVLIERKGVDQAKPKYEQLTPAEIDALAGSNQQRRRAA